VGRTSPSPLPIRRSFRNAVTRLPSAASPVGKPRKTSREGLGIVPLLLRELPLFVQDAASPPRSRLNPGVIGRSTAAIATQRARAVVHPDPAPKPVFPGPPSPSLNLKSLNRETASRSAAVWLRVRGLSSSFRNGRLARAAEPCGSTLRTRALRTPCRSFCFAPVRFTSSFASFSHQLFVDTRGRPHYTGSPGRSSPGMHLQFHGLKSLA
jgi:hypothetical protein